MNNSNQPTDYNDPSQKSEYLFSNQADEDRDEKIEKIEEALVKEEEENGVGGDWGDVDPAGGEEPTAPGSAV